MLTSLLFLAAFAGGALNAVAGGGSFLVFPALLFAGVPPVAANATNAVALWPAALASVAAYRHELRQEREHLRSLFAISLAGSLAGALLLLKTSDAVFLRLVPFLLLFATLVFTFGKQIAGALRLSGRAGASHAHLAGLGVQFFIAIYGGYFGGGMGIMMLAALALFGMHDIHAMNAVKSLLGVAINGVAVAAFVIAGAVAWRPAAIMVTGATLGAYLGATLSRRVDARVMRWAVIGVAWALTIYFFVR